MAPTALCSLRFPPQVTVNGVVAEVTKLLVKGDCVKIRFDDRAAHESVYGREKLNVRYEDDDLAVVVKPSGKTMVAFGFMLPFSVSTSHSADDAQEPVNDEHVNVRTGFAIGAEEEEESGEEGDDVNFDIPTNISPTVGQQHRLPCAIHGIEKAANGVVSVFTWPGLPDRTNDSIHP